MQRIVCPPRPDYQHTVVTQGLVFHRSEDGRCYWNEGAYYELSLTEVDRLHEAARELHQMFLTAAQHVLDEGDGALTRLGLPRVLHRIIRESWEADAWELYGRFDLTLDPDGVPKLIEYNADTPTGLLEAAVIQWYWKEDVHPALDQYNRIHDGLVERWETLVSRRQIRADQPLHFAATARHAEDRMTCGYLAQTAEASGLTTDYLAIGDIGRQSERRQFVDLQNRGITQLFKLYPWEWLADGAFAPHLSEVSWTVLEPPWKAIFASKRLLLTLQEIYPRHPNLLRVEEKPTFPHEVAKPAFGREGANVHILHHGRELGARPGNGPDRTFVYQEFCPLIRSDACHAQCGVWMAGPDPVGLGVREDTHAILSNTSQFVPHVIA